MVKITPAPSSASASIAVETAKSTQEKPASHVLKMFQLVMPTKIKSQMPSMNVHLSLRITMECKIMMDALSHHPNAKGKTALLSSQIAILARANMSILAIQSTKTIKSEPNCETLKAKAIIHIQVLLGSKTSSHSTNKQNTTHLF